MSVCRIGNSRVCHLYGGFWNESATPSMNTHMMDGNVYLQYMRYLTRCGLIRKSHCNARLRVKYGKWKKLY